MITQVSYVCGCFFRMTATENIVLFAKAPKCRAGHTYKNPYKNARIKKVYVIEELSEYCEADWEMNPPERLNCETFH